MSEAAGQFRRVKEHRERPLNRAAALDDGIESRTVLGADLILARDGRESRHDDILRHSGVCQGRIRRLLGEVKLLLKRANLPRAAVCIMSPARLVG